jgi:hypothetical protein
MVPERLTLEVIAQAVEQKEEFIWGYLLTVFEKDPEYDSSEAGMQRLLKSLPRGLQLYYWQMIVNHEILNGGIRQLFWNHGPWEIDMALEALEAIGATETAAHVRDALLIFENEETPESREEFWSADSDFQKDPRLNAIDDARCTDEAAERDWNLMIEYMRRHPEQFVHG